MGKIDFRKVKLYRTNEILWLILDGYFLLLCYTIFERKYKN